MAEETDRIHQEAEQTARQRQIIDLLDNEAGLTEQERKLLHVLATAEKNDLQAQESERKQAVQKRIVLLHIITACSSPSPKRFMTTMQMTTITIITSEMAAPSWGL